MYACVIYTHSNIKKIVPIQWIFANKLEEKKHYICFYDIDFFKKAPNRDELVLNTNDELLSNFAYKIFIHKLIGK